MATRKPTGGLSALWRVPFFALLGATMGTLLDALHVWNEVAGYDKVELIRPLGVAWYVPFEFAAAGVTVGMLRPELDEELKRGRDELPFTTVALSMLCLVVVWGGSGLLMKAGLSNVAIGGVLTAIAFASWALFDRTPQGAIAAVLTGVIGVLVEAGIVVSGTYYYTRPDVIGVPVWLPSLYLTACIGVGNVGRFLKYSWDGPTAAEKTDLRLDA